MRDRTEARLTGPTRGEVVRGEVSLAVHTWDDGRAEADLYYVHGLQSHAGWLFETGPALLDRGVRLTVLDRRGSGHSGGVRGHLPDAPTLLADYASALPAGGTVLGQSFGGSVVAAMTAGGYIPDGTPVVLCAPALGQQRARLSAAGREEVRQRRGQAYSAVRLADEQYTSDPRYLRLMANDVLMVRSLTDSFRATMVDVEDTYLASGPWSRHPVHVALPERDSILDEDVSLAVLESLAPHARIRRFPGTSHYLEFSDAREEYWDWLAEVVRAGGAC